MKTSLLLLAVALAVSPGAPLEAAEAARPNILYFYVDDMGWGSIGPNGQAARKARNKPYVRTPNLDRLAARGVNFTRGYGCHVCSPARSSQQSGFHQGHTFADRNDPNNAKKAMRADDILMGDALSKAGYVTGYWGKWGYGGSKDPKNPTIDNVQTLPTSHGYQYVLAELHHVRAHTFFQPTLWNAPARRGAVGGLQLIPNSMAGYRGNNYPASPALQSQARYPKTAYCDDLYAFHALDFVRKQGQNYNKTAEPFFGLLAVQIPHAPFAEIAKLPDWDKAYATDGKFKLLSAQTRQWAAMVTRIDAHFGNILAALEDPDNDGDTSDSVVDNTLVIFQSDNGGPGGKNNIELDANGGLSGSKGKIQEGGIRVPLVMRWPAKINKTSKLRAGANTDMVVDVTDLLPTFCELAGAPVPLGIDGVSIAPTLLDRGHQRHRAFIIHEAGNGQSIIRGKYKLVRGGKSTGARKSNDSKKGRGKKAAAPKEPALSLFDLEADHGEKKNLAARHPKLADELHALLLGERVTEPHGFANTYHHWIGKDGALASDPDNWSDYQYANAGITYMSDRGAPRLSWIARIENTGNQPAAARADADLQFLALEIQGQPERKAGQTLALGPKINLTGRNEIRLAPHGILTVDKGTVSSLRWIDIQPGGTLSGSGSIDADVFSSGSIAVTGADQPAFNISGDYHQAATATLTVSLSGDRKPSIAATGHARLGGLLRATAREDFTPAPGTAYTVLTADQVTGTFANPGNEVVAADGSRFAIGYARSAVTLTLK